MLIMNILQYLLDIANRICIVIYMEAQIPNATLGFKDACIYCGSKCIVEFDHVIPYSYLSKFDKRTYAEKKRGIKISSCKTCNSMLSNKTLWNFLDRFFLIRKQLELKYKKYNKRHYWSDDEIDELDYSLATFVKAERKKTKHVQEILNWTNTFYFKKAVMILKCQCEKRNDPIVNKIFNSFFVEYENY